MSVSSRPPASPPVDLGWTLLAIGAIACATLTPRPEWANDLRFLSISLPTTPRAWADALGNVLLYVPFGVAVSGRGVSVARTCLAALACSLLTEWCQLLIPGRASSAMDLASNVLGAYFGGVVAATRAGEYVRRVLAAASRWSTHLIAPAQRQAATLSLAWALVIAAVFLTTFGLLSPWVPEAPYVIPSPRLDAPAGPLRIGSTGVPGDFFLGVIDEVRIYDQAREEGALRGDMLSPVARSSADPHLVATYSFDENSGNVAQDVSGNRRDGEVREASWIARGRFGGALAFNGRSSEIVIPAAGLELRDDVTLEAWVRPANYDDRHPMQGNSDPWWTVVSLDSSVYLRASSTTRPFVPAGGGFFGGLFGDTAGQRPIMAGQWSHLAVTYDSQAVRLYLNGELQATTIRWSPYRPSSAAFGSKPLPLHKDRHIDLQSRLLDTLDLRVIVRCGTPNDVRASMFQVLTTYSLPVLRLDAEGDDVWIHSPTVATRFDVPTPDSRVPGALRDCAPGKQLDLTLTGTLRHPQLAADGVVRAGIGSNPAAGWAVLLHSALLPLWAQRAFAALWSALLFFPFGFWARRARASAMGLAVIAATLGVVFTFWSPSEFDWIQLLAAPVGIALGVLINATATHTRDRKNAPQGTFSGRTATLNGTSGPQDLRHQGLFRHAPRLGSRPAAGEDRWHAFLSTRHPADPPQTCCPRTDFGNHEK